MIRARPARRLRQLTLITAALLASLPVAAQHGSGNGSGSGSSEVAGDRPVPASAPPAVPSEAAPSGTRSPSAASSASPSSPAMRGDRAIPASIAAALARARMGSESLHAWIGPAQGGPARWSLHADRLALPASVIKLVTSVVALDQLGPVYAWNTPALVDGPLVQGKLQGSLYLTGRGDPRLVTEKLWLLLSRLQQLGLREIGGDIVIDRSAFELAEVDPGAFDGERFRPYNVQPDAFVVNGKALMLSFHPEPALGLARVGMEPALAGVTVPASVPLLRGDRPADCGDWRGQLQADFSSPDQIRLAGRFPAACGDKTWPVAYADPASFNSRAVAAAWRDLGGKLAGRVREGKAPATASLLQDFPSPLLPEVLRDMNKFSNNLIAQQIFLTLSLAGQGTGRYEASREIVHSRLREKASCSDAEFKIDKGSGLSRQERITAGCLARVLQWAWLSPWMPELLSSLPLAGIEATARRSTGAVGRAHIKTGTLNGVSAIAGYVHGSDGQRRIVVAMINHPLAGGDDSRQVLDAVLRLAAEDLDTRP